MITCLKIKIKKNQRIHLRKINLNFRCLMKMITQIQPMGINLWIKMMGRLVPMKTRMQFSKTSYRRLLSSMKTCLRETNFLILVRKKNLKNSSRLWKFNYSRLKASEDRLLRQILNHQQLLKSTFMSKEEEVLWKFFIFIVDSIFLLTENLMTLKKLWMK